jgi:gamma-glutamyl:cysteine ligase YbdK (ATP-grasp superfamily)
VSKPESNSSHKPEQPLRLFQAYGLELEYMIVHAGTLDVVPAADQLLEAVAGELTDEHENGEIAWNNELALHVIELKCNGPRPSLAGLSLAFAQNVALANARLRDVDRLLMGSAMHPWMDPARELRLWPHGLATVYETFDRVFSCKGHGWANLQSAHLNLPFADDEEFARLHAAIRFLLPILPGLAASSPVLDGARNGIADNRLVVYRTNCAKIPSVTGEVVPESIGSMGEYQETLLARVYRDLEPHDPEGILRHEWVNARGAIARFERMAIEIRVLDVQEAPCVDVAYAALIIEVLKLLCTEQWGTLRSLQSWRTADLATLLKLTERQAEQTGINDRAYLRAFGYPGGSATVGELWEHLVESVAALGTLEQNGARMLEHYLRFGSLATRIGKGVGLFPDRAKLREVYGQLCEALAANAPFKPAPAAR